MQRKSIIAFGIALILIICVSTSSYAETAPTQTTTFIDVGQGDSILLQDGNGFDVLIDGGTADQGPVVLQYLRAHSDTSIEVMVATHAHADHVGGLIAVLAASDIAVDRVYTNGYPATTQTWNDFVAAVTSDGLTLDTLQAYQTLTWGLMTVTVLNPAPGLSNPDQNAASIVLKVTYGSIDTLLTGDIDDSVETSLVSSSLINPLDAEILKVAHHGSAYGSSTAFIESVHPDQAVISVGADNSYGHPSPQTLDRLQASGAATWRTDLDGNIIVTTDGVVYDITSTSPHWHIFLPVILR